MRKSGCFNCNAFVFFCLGLAVLCFSGCASNARISYEGQSFSSVSNAALVTETTKLLQDTGYKQIGTFVSEPTTHGISVSKEAFAKDSQAVLESIAPENCEKFNGYYVSLDKEVCREAAKVGGQKVRLEEITHSYPKFRDDIAVLMEEAMADGITIKTVVSSKIWSVWKKAE